jgi:hypothetical protein
MRAFVALYSFGFPTPPHLEPLPNSQHAVQADDVQLKRGCVEGAKSFILKWMIS